MGRPPTLPEPFATLVTEAGSVGKLRAIMGDVPASTLGRWRRLIDAGHPLPRNAQTAISLAKKTIAKKRKKHHRHQA